MSRYEIDELIQQWAVSKMTHEQAIGQLFLHVKSLDKRLQELERSSERPSGLVQTAMAFVGEGE